MRYRCVQQTAYTNRKCDLSSRSNAKHPGVRVHANLPVLQGHLAFAVLPPFGAPAAVKLMSMYRVPSVDK